MMPTTTTSLILILFSLQLSGQVLGLSGVPNSVCTRYESEWYSQSYTHTWYETCVDWDFRCTRRETRYRNAYRTKTIHFCCSGYTDNGSGYCVPVCYGSTSCPNGGTCSLPDRCTSCNIEYYSPKCDPCPVAEIDNCAHMSCDEGPSNKRCFECDLQYQSVTNECAYTPNGAQSFCDPRCSWLQYQCFPGSCSNGYPSSCSCASGFSSSGTAMCDLTKKPDLALCKFTVLSSSGERRQSQPTVEGDTSCYTEGDEWIKFVPKDFKLDLEANFQHPTYTKLAYVRDFKYGITKSSVWLYKKPAGSAVNIITYTMPGDGVCNPGGPYGDGDGQPKDQIQCDIDKSLSYTSFADGDKLCAEYKVVAGGYTHYGDPNTNVFHQTQKYNDVPRTKTVCMRMDFTNPTHCSRVTGANKCTSPTEYMTFGDRIRKTGAITLDFSGWDDLGTNPSGIKEYIINVYEITERSPSTVGMVFSPVKVGPITVDHPTTSKQFTLPSQPQFYAIDLTVVDNALNVLQARSYVLYDSSSKLLTDSSKDFYYTSATEVTDYLWQTNLGSIKLSWTDYFYNDYHRTHAPLRPVAAEANYYTDSYDQVAGDLPREGTDNIHGILSFKYHIEKLTPLGTKDPTTSEPNSWTDVTTWLNEDLTLGSSVVTPADGDTFKTWIHATDIMENEISDNIMIHFDSSPAELWDMWLIKDGHTQLYIHDSHELHKMKLVFEARDVHSGVRKVFYRLGVESGGTMEHGQGAIPVRHLGTGENCPSGGDPCYCPKVGPCEYTSYSLDLNPIVANNTHIGLHNRDYFFEIEVENEARLVKKFELKIHTDNSPPTNGTVWDGGPGQKDVDYRSDNAVVGSWGGFVDYESGIKYYRYAVADRCWTTDELYNSGTKTTDTTTGSLTTSLTHYFVSVIAINNAVTPSVPSCTDGVVVDKTPPVFVSYKVPHGIFTNNQPPIYHHKDTLELFWVFNEAESQIHDYEIGFASAENKQASPDIVDYQTTHMKAHFKRLHTGFGQSSRVFVMIKAINKVGLETVKAIGPFIIDQTPPTTSKSFTPSIGAGAVTLSWSATDFSDNDDENALAKFKWALGTNTNVQELVKFTDIQVNAGKYQASFPLNTLVEHDNEADKEYFFAIEVFNTVHLSAIFKSEGFRLPTTTKPPVGVVQDISDDSNAASEPDIDFQFSTTKMCAKWSGFEHYRDTVTYKAALGLSANNDDIKSFTNVNTAKSHCFTGLSLPEKMVYFIVKATGSIGEVTVASDGVRIVDQSVHQSELEVFDGWGCEELSSCSSDTSYQSSRLHVAGWWRHSGNLNALFTHYVASIVEDTCTQQSNAISCTEVGSVLADVNVGKMNRYVFGNLSLVSGRKYHVKIAMCFQTSCLPAVASSGVLIYNNDVQPYTISAFVASVKKVNDSLTVVIDAEWTPFSVTEGSLQSKAIEHKWAVTSEPDGKASITNWTDVSSSYGSTKIQVSHEIHLKHKPLKTLHFSVKGYNPLGTCAISSTPLPFEIGDTGIDEGHYIFDLHSTDGVRSLINSEKLGERSRILHSLDLDYVTRTTSVSAAISGLQYPAYYWYITDTPGAVHHYIQWSYNLTDHPVNATNATMLMPFGCAFGMKECIGNQIYTVNNFVTFTGLSLNHGTKYFTCVHCNETVIVREKSKQRLPELRMCSNGYIVDTTPPTPGTVKMDTVSDGFTYNNKELVITWSGFTDLEEMAGEGMFHSSGIKNYQYGIGTSPGAVDVRQFVDVGESQSVTATGLSLESGTTYYATVRAYDHVGLWTDAVSQGVLVDTTPPEPSFVRVGTLSRHTPAVHCDRFEVHWGDFIDSHSASLTYKIAIGRHQHSQDISPFAEAAHNFAIFSGLSLVKGHSYYAQISGTNVVGLTASASSPVFTCDDTLPSKGFVYDGDDTSKDADYQQDTTSLSANWFGFQDAETTVRYMVAVGTEAGKQDIHTYEDIGQSTGHKFIFQLIPGQKYYTTVKACNDVNLCTTATSDGVIADDTPPLPGIIRVGYDDFHSVYQAETSSITIRWFGFHDPHSYLDHYEWCIGADAADDCSEISYTNAHLSQEVYKGGLSLTAHKKLYVKIKATNNAQLVTVASSTHFIIDNTAPTVKTTPAFNVNGLSRKANTQFDRSIVRITWEFTDAQSPIVRHAVSVKSHDDNEHPVADYQMDSARHVTFELSGGRQMADGDQYWAKVYGCNAAGLCTIGTSAALLVDSTPPHLGHFKHTLTYGGSGATASLEWEEFYDGQSGIEKYVIAFGSNYHSWDVLAPTDVSHNANSPTQSHTFTLAKTLNVGDVVYITIYAVNGAGMTSDIGQTSVEVVAPDKLFIQRHSCVVFGCKKVCSCGEYGGTFYNCRHNGAAQSCPAVSAPGALTVVDGLDINNNQAYTGSDKCLSGTWSSHNDAVRYEWGFGKKGDGIGSALFNFATEKFIFDNGLVTIGVYCLPFNKKLDQSTEYSLYVRYWWSANQYTEKESTGVKVDHTPPAVARGYGVLDTASSSANVDIEYTTSTSAIYARWDNTFRDSDSGIDHYEVMVGTTMEGNELVEFENVGTATTFSKTGLSIPAGTKYYVTVRAVNGVGLTANKSSDGVIVDNEPPLAGAVFNGIWKHAHRYMSNSDTLEISWIGFDDRHSFIKEYHWGIGSSKNQADVKSFVNVGILNRVSNPKVSLTHGSTYYVVVKAVDAAGQQTIAASPPFMYDESPPIGYQSSSLGSDVASNGNFAGISESNFNSAWTVVGTSTFNAGTGLTLLGKLSQTITIPSFSLYQFVVQTAPPCNQLYSEISIGAHTYILDLTDGLTVCTFTMTTPIEEGSVELSLNEDVGINVTKISLKKVTNTSPLDAALSITIHQTGMTDLFVHWSTTDIESRIRYARIGLGSTSGGLQLAPLENVGRRPSKAYRDLPLKHGLPVYVSLLVVNEADEQTTIISAPKIIDWLAPTISNITLKFILNNPTSIDVTANWVVQAESGIEKCFWALGLVHGNTDVLQWTATDATTTSTASALSLSHGAKIYPSIRCISHAHLEVTTVGDPLLIVITPPDVSSASLTAEPLSSTFFKALSGYQSSTEFLDLAIAGVTDNAGIREYHIKLCDNETGEVLMDYFELAEHTHFILNQIPLNESDLYNETCFNVSLKPSEKVTALPSHLVPSAENSTVVIVSASQSLLFVSSTLSAESTPSSSLSSPWSSTAGTTTILTSPSSAESVTTPSASVTNQTLNATIDQKNATNDSWQNFIKNLQKIDISQPTHTVVCERDYFIKTFTVSFKAVNMGGMESNPVSTQVSFYVGPPELTGKEPTLYRNNITSKIHIDWHNVFKYTGPADLRYVLSMGMEAGMVSIVKRVDTKNTNYQIPTHIYRFHVNYTATIDAITPFGTYHSLTSKIINTF